MEQLSQIFSHRALTLFKLNRLKEALYDSSKGFNITFNSKKKLTKFIFVAIQCDSNNPVGFIASGLVKNKLGKYDLAIVDFTKVLEIESKNNVSFLFLFFFFLLFSFF